MSFSTKSLLAAKKSIMSFLFDNLLEAALERRMKAARRIYDSEVQDFFDSGLGRQQVESATRSLCPDKAAEKEYAKSNIRDGVGVRLDGAIALYQTGDQLECVRHIMLAIGAVCNILGWDEAEKYLSEQNVQLNARRDTKL